MSVSWCACDAQGISCVFKKNLGVSDSALE